MSERLLAPHDRRGTQMKRPPPLRPEVAIYGLADEQMREGNPPARRGLLLEQNSGPFGLAQRRSRGRQRFVGQLGEQRAGQQRIAARMLP